MSPDLVAEFVRAFNEEINKSRRERDHRRESLLREQKEVEGRIDTLLDAFASGALKGPSVQAKLEALESRQTALATELNATPVEPVRLHPNLADIYRQKVAKVHDLLANDATRTEAVEIIRSLIDTVTFRLGPGSQLEIELVGDLAQIVHLAQAPSGNGPVSGAVAEEFAKGGCGGRI
jgi:site-specific DNA recombinase